VLVCRIREEKKPPQRAFTMSYLSTTMSHLLSKLKFKLGELPNVAKHLALYLCPWETLVILRELRPIALKRIESQ
jgi:hypothetical protein